MKTNKLWFGFIAIIVVCFGILGFYGHEIYREKPPVPEQVIAENGTVLFTAQQIKDGQNVWQSIGGQEVGTVWGHGAYVAPDWSADWLHKEAMYILNEWASKDSVATFDDLNEEQQAVYKVKLQKMLRTNTYDNNTGILTVPDERAAAIISVSAHYAGLFMNDPKL